MVADASVLAAVAFEEPEADQAQGLITGQRLHEPHLLAYELANIARNETRQSPSEQDRLAHGLAHVLAMDITWMRIEPVAVLRLAIETGLTAYDASYLYLAMALGLPLATFDRDLRAAAAGRVQLL